MESLKNPAECSVLVVDDERALLTLVVRTIEPYGFVPGKIFGANDVGPGLLALENKPDLLITDLNMPGGSGLDVALKARELNPGIRIIIMSGLMSDNAKGMAEKFATLEATGSFTKLEKPFNSNGLPIALIREGFDIKMG